MYEIQNRDFPVLIYFRLYFVHRMMTKNLLVNQMTVSIRGHPIYYIAFRSQDGDDHISFCYACRR